MTTSNLVVTVPVRQVRQELIGTAKNGSSEAVLADVFGRGDLSSVAAALNIPHQRMSLMLQGLVRTPLAASAILVEQLRRNNNPRADEAFLWLARRLGFVAFRNNEAAADDERLAKLIREFADVMETRADVDADGVRTAAERRELAKQAFELSEAALAYAREQLQRAGEAR